ncbi:MAG TPA: amidase, partial [Gemmatimonadaceae bacterium]|nr:amidase [Gemmatimonadaceae bacterium]
MTRSLRRPALAALTSLLLGAVPPLAAQAFDVRETTIADIHAALRANRLTCRALVQQYLARIHVNDKQGAAINALITINARALGTADSLDQVQARGG